MTTRLEKVTTGQRVRVAGRGEYRRVESHGAGRLHGIEIRFSDGSSLTAMPDTRMEVAA